MNRNNAMIGTLIIDRIHYYKLYCPSMFWRARNEGHAFVVWHNGRSENEMPLRIIQREQRKTHFLSKRSKIKILNEKKTVVVCKAFCVAIRDDRRAQICNYYDNIYTERTLRPVFLALKFRSSPSMTPLYK